MRALSAWLTGLFAACSGGASQVSRGQEFELDLRQAVRVAGTDLSLGFDAVEQDSRCPGDVTCVWAGNAVVTLRLTGAGCDTLLRLNTGLEPRRGTGCAIPIEVRGLEPTPRSDELPSARRYRVRLLLPPT